MRRLNVYVSSDFFESREHLQTIGIHPGETRTEGEICINLLESGERMIENGDRAFNNGAISKTLNVARVNDFHTLARFRAGPIARNALAINSLFVNREKLITHMYIFPQNAHHVQKRFFAFLT